MGKVLTINKTYKLINGITKGITGILIGYDAIENVAYLKIDEHSNIMTTSENLKLVTA